MPYPTETKHYSSTYPDAPQIIADAGGYVGFLDAILVTGYGIAALGDIVVTDGVAVASVPAGHSLRKWQVAAHAGAGHAGLNGEHRVIAASGNTYTFEVVGVPNGTYSGGSTRVAPLGYEISYQSGHKRIYRSKDTARRNAVSLYVDDSNTVADWNIGNNKALVQARMVCDVVDIDSYTTLGTTWWPKSDATSGTSARPWLLAGDALGFYTAVDVVGNGKSIASNHYCQLNTLAAGDQYATMLEGGVPTTDPVSSTSGIGCSGAAMNALSNGTRAVARGLAQGGVAIPLRYSGFGVLGFAANQDPRAWLTSGAAMSAQSSTFVQAGSLASVNPADGGLVLGRPVLAIHGPAGEVGGENWTARATLPGVASVPSTQQWGMSPALLEAPAGWAGACLLGLPALAGYHSVGGSASITSKSVGGYYVDVVGAWR